MTAATERNRARYKQRMTQGYRGLRYARLCPRCRTKNVYWVQRQGVCFACSIAKGNVQ